MGHKRKFKMIISVNGESHEIYATIDKPEKVTFGKGIVFSKDGEVYLIIRDAYSRHGHSSKSAQRHSDRLPYKTPRRSIKRPPNRKRFGGGRNKPEFDD